ncbi:outer membrane protein assembly factor BamE [Reinekea marinisedimentorum]|uniref:Outer membrane protein assembly factor BamE n=1 Tax=Reinekea marinisedimentorum TaxID=230495 RepID=A0A4R3IA00_9GAMM|nr:outer membrane protein assembly factor BamE [Reinekea marinisedimentorum]
MLFRLSKYVLLCSFTLALSACGLLKPYEAELGQGNSVKSDQLEQIEIGLTKEQVAFILGTPMLSGLDPEHRWIYTTFSEDNGYASLVIEFADGLVSNINTSDNLIVE